MPGRRQRFVELAADLVRAGGDDRTCPPCSPRTSTSSSLPVQLTMRKTRPITRSTATAIRRDQPRARRHAALRLARRTRAAGPPPSRSCGRQLRRRLLARVDLLEEVELDVVVVELLAHRWPGDRNAADCSPFTGGILPLSAPAEPWRSSLPRGQTNGVRWRGRPTAVAPGSLVLGRYRPIRPLGSGGLGIGLARREEESRAATSRSRSSPATATRRARAEREASAAARLRHERCLRAHAFARDPGHVYIVYDYVPGRTLREAMRAGELTDAAALEAGAQILDGLAHAHAHGIVHRDVKPANVLLVGRARTSSVKLFDFGLAVMHEEETLTAVGDIPGTLAYISPERLTRRSRRGRPQTSGRSACCSGRRSPASTRSGAARCSTPRRRIEAGAPSLASVRPDLDRPIVECVDRALAIEPSRRPTAAALADAAAQGRVLARRRAAPRPLRRSLTPDQALRVSTARRRPPFLFAAWTAAALPFFPAGWALVDRPAVAGARRSLEPAARARLRLAVPVLPLGNYALAARRRLRHRGCSSGSSRCGASREAGLLLDGWAAARRRRPARLRAGARACSFGIRSAGASRWRQPSSRSRRSRA